MKNKQQLPPFARLYRMEKRFKKVEKQYNAAGPVARKRIMRTAEFLQNKIDALKKLLYKKHAPKEVKKCDATLATGIAPDVNLTQPLDPAQTTPDAMTRDS